VGRCIVDRDYDREVGFGLGHRLLVLRSIEIPDVPCDALHEYFDRLDGRPGVVGREQQAVRFTDREQGIARFERFVRENIEPRPGEPSGGPFSGTEKEEQLNSYNSQLKYYEKKIKSNSNWGYVGIYADE